jgi:hypothetical protein
MNIELHLFTNSTVNAPSTFLVEETYNSFLKIFQTEMPLNVWVDSNPNKINFNHYYENLNKLFDNVTITSSLSDGYLKAVEQSNSDFMFMLEHDWVFNNNIKHSLENILEVMTNDNLLHFRFNKRKNIIKNWDKELTEVKNPILNYCLTSNLSNNPHIINRSKWIKEAKHFIKNQKGNIGIEQELIKANLKGAIYGGLNYPNTIDHLNGKYLLG